MKNRCCLTFIIASLIFTIFSYGKCFAAEPTVAREYITRKKGEVRTEEEKLNIEYTDLSMKQKGYLKISFINNENVIIEEYEMEIFLDDLLQNEMNLKSDALQGTVYIKMEIISPGYEHTYIKLPLKI